MQHSSELSLAQALHRHDRNNRQRGFLWATGTALLWGAWYVPGAALWRTPPFVDLATGDAASCLAAIAAVMFLHAIAVFACLTLRNGLLGKLPDLPRTLARGYALTRWYALAALAGALALFGTCLAMIWTGPLFAALSSLCSPVVGALWHRKIITRRAILGVAFLLASGILIDAPVLSHAPWPGWLGGLLSALGWGAEGLLAARAMEVSDAAVGLQCRSGFAILFWGALVLPALAGLAGLPVGPLLLTAIRSGTCLLWILLAAICQICGQVGLYRSATLIGASRGAAISNLYGVVALLFLTAIALVLPPWYDLAGLACAVVGQVVLANASAGITSRARDARADRKAQKAAA